MKIPFFCMDKKFIIHSVNCYRIKIKKRLYFSTNFPYIMIIIIIVNIIDYDYDDDIPNFRFSDKRKNDANIIMKHQKHRS